MTPRTRPLPRPLRLQRGVVARGVLVAVLLAGALGLQSGSPAWQSRLDAVAAFVGLSSPGPCEVPASASGSTAAAPERSGHGTAGWRPGASSMVAGTAAHATGAGSPAPAI